MEVLRRDLAPFAVGLGKVPRLKGAKVSDTATERSAVSTRVQFLHFVH